MADALCGPSNALSSFQKHTQVDRTLQQDRLASRQTSHENFRSSPLAPSPQADAEFLAFQSSHAPSPDPFLSQYQHVPPFQQQPHHAPKPLAQPGLPSWAADFQHLSLHEARQSPIPAAHLRSEAPPQQRSSPAAPWHAEFMRQERTATPPVASPTAFGPSFSQMGGMGGFGGFQAAGPAMGMGAGATQQMPGTQVDTYDDAAFAAAFDNAAALFGEAEGKGKGKEVGLEEYQQAHPSVSAQETKMQEGLQGTSTRSDAAKASEGIEEFSMEHACVDPPDAFSYDAFEESQMLDIQEALRGDPQTLPQQQEQPQEQQQVSPEVEADELSRTAGQLLDNLKHEQSDKFAKSNFMTLMRQLRDKEVRVDGERFVETAHALHPGGPTYPPDSQQESHVPVRPRLTKRVTLSEDRYSTGDALEPRTPRFALNPDQPTYSEESLQSYSDGWHQTLE